MMIELHMSCLENTDIESLGEMIRASRLPILALNYNEIYHWLDAGFTEEECVKSLLCA